MTTVLLCCGPDGALRRVSASGHAGFAAKGKDIVCAAETVLLRTALEFLQSDGKELVSADTSVRGNLSFSVKGNGSVERRRFAADFLRLGLSDLAGEYPECLQFRELTEN